MVYQKTKHWNEESESVVKNFVQAFEEGIIANAEALATAETKNDIEARQVELAIYKSIAEFNCMNKLNILEVYGYEEAYKTIATVETDAMHNALSVFTKAAEIIKNLPSSSFEE